MGATALEQLESLDFAGADLDLLDGQAMVQELSKLHVELDLAQRQRELLQSIKDQIDTLPSSMQGDALASMMDIFKEGVLAEEGAPAEEAAPAEGIADKLLAEQADGMENKEDADARFAEFSELSEDNREKDFAMDLMEILVRPKLSEEEQETLRPMARHVLQRARKHVSTAIVVEKIPALLDDVVAGELVFSPSEMLACALATPVLGLEFARRPALIGQLEPIELLTLLCKSQHPMAAEAIATEAPQLEDLCAEHVALLKEESPQIAKQLFSNPFIAKRLASALDGLRKVEDAAEDAVGLQAQLEMAKAQLETAKEDAVGLQAQLETAKAEEAKFQPPTRPVEKGITVER